MKWDERRAWAEGLSQAVDAAFVLEKDDDFVWIETQRATGHATCFLAVQDAGQSVADLFSESEALGTLQSEGFTYRALISRAVKPKEDEGWITVIQGVALQWHETSPPDFGRKLSADTAITFITGPLR